MDASEKLIAAQLGSAAIVAAAVIWGSSHLAGALRSSAGAPEGSQPRTESSWPLAPGTPSARSTTPGVPTTERSPIDPATFMRQWDGNYGKIADEKCWRPHAQRYLELPGHLDLKLSVSNQGKVGKIDLVGFTNPGDKPDPALVQQVFECVSAILRTSKFPDHPGNYTVEGRVNRPNPPGPPGVPPPDELEAEAAERAAQAKQAPRPPRP